MTQSLIREAARRGRAEAERRDLQYRIDDAYHAEIEKVEAKRRRAEEGKQARHEAAVRAKAAGRTLSNAALNLGWAGVCLWLAVTEAWEEVPALDDLFEGNRWLAVVALLVLFLRSAPDPRS